MRRNPSDWGEESGQYTLTVAEDGESMQLSFGKLAKRGNGKADGASGRRGGRSQPAPQEDESGGEDVQIE